MPNLPNTNASTVGGAHVNQAGGPAVTNLNKQPAQSITCDGVLASKSTATDIQLEKILLLLRQGPKTTIELREHSILMPASRIFELKRDRGCIITTELVALYDDRGARHSKCARYHLHVEMSAVGEA